MIISCLLTRRCNLNCHYCRLVKNYQNKPESYPTIQEFTKLERDYKFWCDVGEFFKQRNAFILLYGGEPTLYKDLFKITDYYNENNIPYSIITNATKPDLILNNVHKLFGITTSIDPGLNTNDDRKLKSDKGLKLLIDCIKKNPKIDAVAEVVLDKTNYRNITKLAKLAKENGFRISVTIIETSQNDYYDFTDPSSGNLLLSKKDRQELLSILDDPDIQEVMINPYAIQNILKENKLYFCDPSLEHAYAIDPDGKVRLCLRIRGVNVPNINFEKYILNNDYKGFYNEYCEQAELDMKLYCEGCSWTCAEMKNADLKTKNII